MSVDGPPGGREIAYRLFASEYNDSTLEHSDSDEERAPKYVITPTGARINRCFVVGVLTEVEWVNEELIRARIADPTGAFVVYAGQYQPDALSFLDRTDPPSYVAVTGKANTFRPEGSDRVFTSIRPESISEVDEDTRDRWTVQAAEHTLQRIDRFAAAMEHEPSLDRDRLREMGLDDSSAAGIALAGAHYRTTAAYLGALRRMAVDALRLIAGEIDSVDVPSIEPDESPEDIDPETLRLPADAPLATASPSPRADETPAAAEPPTAAPPAEETESKSGPAAVEGKPSAPADVATDTADVDTGDAVDREEEDAEPSDTTASPAPEETDDEPGEKIDLEDAVVEAMQRLADENDDGGAAGEAVVSTVVDRYGVDVAAVEAAIESALLAGRCYEPEDDIYKPI